MKSRIYLGLALLIAVVGTLMIAGTGAPSGEITLVVAASDSSSTVKSGADFVCDGIDDQDEINIAFNSLPGDGGIVVLTEGTYVIDGDIRPVAYSTLQGQGVDKTNIRGPHISNPVPYSQTRNILVRTPYVTLHDFRITGGMSIRYENSHGLVHDVDACTGPVWRSAFWVYNRQNDHHVIEDIEFRDCRAIDCGSFGFLLHAETETQPYRLVRNVRFIRCQARNIGKSEPRLSEWVTGFDIAELNDVEDCLLQDCVAEGCWESGFHIEDGPDKQNVRFINCAARDNAQKRVSGQVIYFGSGFFLGEVQKGGSVVLENCTANDENYIGFLVKSNSGNVELRNCTANNAAFSNIEIWKAHGRILLEDCVSEDSRGYGIRVINASGVTTKNLRIINPQEIDGVGNVFGLEIYPISDSAFDLSIEGGTADTMVVCEGSSNLTFSGAIQSSSRNPMNITNSSEIDTQFLSIRNGRIHTMSPSSGGSWFISFFSDIINAIFQTIEHIFSIFIPR